VHLVGAGSGPDRVTPGHRLVGGEYEGQPDERAFVNWLLEQHSEFSQIHLHSVRTIRCGLTLLQRSVPLARSPGAQQS
jgi:hypothetical protein